MNTTDKMRHSQQLKQTQKLLVEAALRAGEMHLRTTETTAEEIGEIFQVFAALTSQYNEQMLKAGRK